MSKNKDSRNKEQPSKFSPQKMLKGTSDALLKNPLSVKGEDDAPVMGFLDNEMIHGIRIRDRMKGMGPSIRIIPRMFLEMRKAKRSIKKNHRNPKTIITEELLLSLKQYCKELGLVIGFTKLRKELIFRNEAVLYDNVIVLSMEMDYNKMDKAPSAETQGMIIKTYNNLGIIANRIASFLRKNGFRAQACHPLGGPICYPPLIGDAGMGWYGRHGIAIIPEFGPRHRVAAVLTSIENLPINNTNEHKWIEEYCTTCGRCIQKCPTKAIYEKCRENDNGTKTHIDNKLCFKEFSTNYGCSVCVKECM
ncbi:MAG: 4Fe-4S binding protein, partial [Candidatus Thorarchaeota archaeon]